MKITFSKQNVCMNREYKTPETEIVSINPQILCTSPRPGESEGTGDDGDL